MIKEKVRETQPVVFQTLQNALCRGKVAHAYLFTGVKGTPKKETALFLAQCLLCEHTENQLACEVCDTCRRIEEGNYADIIFLDGTEKSIKKESILNLQEKFSKTALEKGGKKFYILDRADNATPEALNSLLKFLEEPNGQDTVAILTVESIERLLPTIVSRCQIIPFKPLQIESCYEKGLEEGLTKLDSYVLSHLAKDSSLMKEISEQEEYQVAMVAVERFISDFEGNIDRFLVWFQLEILGDKEKDKSIFLYFLDVLLLFLRDIVSGESSEESWYAEGCQKLKTKNYPYETMILILLEAKDKCTRPYHLALLIEQTIYQIKEVLLRGRK